MFCFLSFDKSIVLKVVMADVKTTIKKMRVAAMIMMMTTITITLTGNLINSYQHHSRYR